MKDKRRYSKKGEIVVRKIGGEVFLVPVKKHLDNQQRLYVLNPVAEYIWENLDGQQDLASIEKKLLEKFSVNRDQAREDMEEFINHLREEDLISEVG